MKTSIAALPNVCKDCSCWVSFWRVKNEPILSKDVDGVGELMSDEVFFYIRTLLNLLLLKYRLDHHYRNLQKTFDMDC